jgi:hypothetical protein
MTDVSDPSTRSALRDARRERVEDGRQLTSAGRAVGVIVAALVIACLLNAPGLHKSAYNQDAGPKRDVALAVTGALADVSHALLLDRPREAVKWSLGRSDDDTIDTAIVLPPTHASPAPSPASPAPAPAAAPAPAPSPSPEKVAFTPKRPLRLWVAGDSLVIVPGWSIVRAAGASAVIEPLGGPDGRVGTGLGRPDVFNWFEKIRATMAESRPEAVVLGFGGNDDHSYMTGLPANTRIGEFGTPSWTREYRRRVGGVMDTIADGGAQLIWIGLPITRSPAQTIRFDLINAIVREEALKRAEQVSYIDTYTLFASRSGGFTEYLEDGSGRRVKMRAGDGVHFERHAGDVIARAVLKRLNAVYDLTSWRRDAKDKS